MYFTTKKTDFSVRPKRGFCMRKGYPHTPKGLEKIDFRVLVLMSPARKTKKPKKNKIQNIRTLTLEATAAALLVLAVILVVAVVIAGAWSATPMSPHRRILRRRTGRGRPS